MSNTSLCSEDGFQDLQDKFLNEHCDEFENEEENKLIYTDIYNQYISTLEGYIANRMMELCPSFKMSALLELIQARPEEVDLDLFETLTSLADFTMFKETMINYKSQRDCQFDNFPSLLVTSLAGGLPKH